MLNSDFKEFAELLNANGVEYLVVGGYALAAHGHPRYTGDIDFWVSHDAANIDRLLKTLHDFGFGSLGLSAADFTDDTVVQLGQPPLRIDLLTGIDGVDFTDCWLRRETVTFSGVNLHLIGLQDFKANKRAAGRLKDLADSGGHGKQRPASLIGLGLAPEHRQRRSVKVVAFYATT